MWMMFTAHKMQLRKMLPIAVLGHSRVRDSFHGIGANFRYLQSPVVPLCTWQWLMGLCLWGTCRHNRSSSEKKVINSCKPPLRQSLFTWNLALIPLYFHLNGGVCFAGTSRILPVSAVLTVASWVQRHVLCIYCLTSRYVQIAQKSPKSGQCLGPASVVPESNSSWKSHAAVQDLLGRYRQGSCKWLQTDDIQRAGSTSSAWDRQGRTSATIYKVCSESLLTPKHLVPSADWDEYSAPLKKTNVPSKTSILSSSIGNSKCFPNVKVVRNLEKLPQNMHFYSMAKSKRNLHLKSWWLLSNCPHLCAFLSCFSIKIAELRINPNSLEKKEAVGLFILHLPNGIKSW